MEKIKKQVPLSWFTSILSQYKGRIAELLVLAFVLRILTIVIPFSFQTLIDKIIPYQRYYSLYFMLAILLLVAVVKAYFSFVEFLSSERLGILMGQDMAEKFYRHFFCLSPSWHMKWRSGDILARIGEIGTIQGFISSVIFGISLDIIFIGFYLILLFMINVKLTFVFLAILPIQLILFFITGPLLRKRLQESFEAGADVESIVVENIHNTETIKSLHLEEKALSRFFTPFKHSLIADYRLSFLSHILDQLLDMIGSIREALIIIIGAYFIFQGELTVGALIAFYLLSEQVVDPLEGIAGIWEDVQQVRVSRARLGDILTTEPENLNETPLSSSRLESLFTVNNISFSWGKNIIFEDLNFAIKPASFVGILGASGVGKTTLAKVMAALLPSKEGEVLYKGDNIENLPLGSYRRNVAYIPAKSDIFSGSVRENLNPHDFDYKDEDYLKALHSANADFLLNLPDGLETKIGAAAHNLSTGQQQRLIIARALLCKAKTLIFDEPTASLDKTITHKIILSLKNLCKKGYTIIVITHDQSIYTYFDDIIELGGKS